MVFNRFDSYSVHHRKKQKGDLHMKLSELVYECVKNVKYLDDPNFTYESFMLGDYDNDMDYSNSINNVFTPLNTAIHRLSDRRKIKNEIVFLGALPINRTFDISVFK